MDDEFLRTRNRPGNVSDRFPSVFRRSDPSNILVARTPRGIASALVFHDTRLDHGRLLRQIGLVSTRAEFRKQGFGSALLRFAHTCIAQDQVSVALLWTSAYPFYQRLGWWRQDSSCVAKVEGSSVALAPTRGVIELEQILRADEIRREWAPHLAPRSIEAWRTVPTHADEVDLIIENNGFALVGKRNETGYLYEVVGPKYSWLALWRRICERHRRIVANGQLGSSWVRWMAKENNAAWAANSLGMRFVPYEIVKPPIASLPHFSVIDRI